MSRHLRDLADQGAYDLGHAASGRVQHAVGGGLEEQHAGQVQHQRRILRQLQLLQQGLPVLKEGLPAGAGAHTHTHTQITLQDSP